MLEPRDKVKGKRTKDRNERSEILVVVGKEDG